MPRGRWGEFEVSSVVPALPAGVWERITTPEGVNYEIRPWMRMTFPRRLEALEPKSVELGRPLGRCWLWLFGVVPFDYDELRIVELEPGHRFLERSTMLSLRRWEHERIVEPAADGARVTDRVGFEPRLGLPAAPLVAPIRALFRHRHRRLGKWFVGPAG